MEEGQQNQADVTELGILEGHRDWVTCLAAGHSQKENEDSNILISGSRDKTLMIWNLYDNGNFDGKHGDPVKSLTGHNHFVSDISLSNDNCFCISSSWDRTLRLWDLKTGKTQRTFDGHTKEVYTCTFSPDNRQIISAGGDKGVKLWNILGDNKFTTENNNHTDWVSSLRYSPILKNNSKTQLSPYFTSVGWDGRLKIWNTNFQIRYTFKAHKNNVNTVSISPNGRYVATGGKDQELNIWDVGDLQTYSRIFEVKSNINQIAFNPKLYWVAAATDNGVKIWDLMTTKDQPICVLTHQKKSNDNQGTSEEKKKSKDNQKSLACTSLCWNALGKKLFAGFSDGTIKVWQVQNQNSGEK